MSRIRGGVAVLLGLLVLVPSAEAARRYAAPGSHRLTGRTSAAA